MPDRHGEVRIDGVRVGEISETPDGSAFTYDATWCARRDAVPISVRLPLQLEPHAWRGGLHPFFENLLPEGWLLELAVQKLKIPANDAFGLLLATCRDCVGAVEVVPLGSDDTGARS